MSKTYENQVYHFMIRWSKPESIPLCEFKDHIQVEKIIKTKCDKYIFQHEMTKNIWNDENHHYQGYGHTKKKIRPRQLAGALGKLLPGVVVQAASNDGREALQKYSMKNETRIDGPWADNRHYMGEDLNIELLPWQKTIEKEIIETKANDRTINWIVNSEGCSGKSKLVKYMFHYHDCVYLSYSDARDALNLVSKFMHKKAYLFDLPRTKPTKHTKDDIYNVMEQIKNGMIMNTKYETNIHLMNPPHVWVFANYAPNLMKLTKDRWKIWKIVENKLILIYICVLQT